MLAYAQGRVISQEFIVFCVERQALCGAVGWRGALVCLVAPPIRFKVVSARPCSSVDAVRSSVQYPGAHGGL